jgi:RNA polymerase sigma-32 factor
MQRLQPNRSGALTNDVAQQISRSLGVPIDDVLEMEQRLSGDLSLNAPLSGLDDAAEWQDIIADDSPNIETLLAANDERDRQRAALTDALSVLDDRERKIFAARHLRERPESFEQIGQSLSISAERVRQLEARAYTKVASAARRVCKGLQALPQPSAALPARRAPLPRLVNAAAAPAFA